LIEPEIHRDSDLFTDAHPLMGPQTGAASGNVLQDRGLLFAVPQHQPDRFAHRQTR
jgi:hypothetical protein